MDPFYRQRSGVHGPLLSQQKGHHTVTPYQKRTYELAMSEEAQRGAAQSHIQKVRPRPMRNIGSRRTCRCETCVYHNMAVFTIKGPDRKVSKQACLRGATLTPTKKDYTEVPACVPPAGRAQECKGSPLSQQNGHQTVHLVPERIDALP